MQIGFDFLAQDLLFWNEKLLPLAPSIGPPRRTPIQELIRSLLSARTRDAVSDACYARLCFQLGTPGQIMAAGMTAVEKLIAPVTFAGDKAHNLVLSLRKIAIERPDFDLGFLGGLGLHASLQWLERLPGVGRKVSAATLNASTLEMPVMIVDTHILRVLQRLKVVGPTATYRHASIALTSAFPQWDGYSFRLLHRRLKRLGQQFCHVREPFCHACPLALDCPAIGLIQDQSSSE